MQLKAIWPGLFEKWITQSTGQITTAWFVLFTLIHWMAIYPVDSYPAFEQLGPDNYRNLCDNLSLVINRFI